MKSKLVVIREGLLALIVVLTFIYSTQTASQLSSLKNAVEEKTNKVVVYEGKDGHTPVKGVDYFDGTNGLNAMSYTVNTTVIKEVPIIGPVGPQGRDGLDAPIQELRVNPETGDIESKLSTERGWNLLVACNELKVGCPGE